MGLIGLAIVLVLILILIISWMIYRRKRNLSKNKRDALSSIDEIVTVEKNKNFDKKTDSTNFTVDEQQLNTVQTALSPPKHQRKDLFTLSNLDQPRTGQGKLFSLSPPLEDYSGRPKTPASIISRISGHSHRKSIPFQVSVGQIWRGPTPPWTMSKY